MDEHTLGKLRWYIALGLATTYDEAIFTEEEYAEALKLWDQAKDELREVEGKEYSISEEHADRIFQFLTNRYGDGMPNPLSEAYDLIIRTFGMVRCEARIAVLAWIFVRGIMLPEKIDSV